ncbi:MAG: hypothetical protein IPM23_00940 [Candidatus Melainabacteria bacterium]|nr:hypothetical protein [Candidatus Melainabacteria bacterium]
MTPANTIQRRRNRRLRGQAISEYAMILAFVAIIVAMVFAFAPGKLAPAVSGAFSRMAQELNNMTAYADSVSMISNFFDTALFTN